MLLKISIKAIPVYDITENEESLPTKMGSNDPYQIIQTSRIGNLIIGEDNRESLPFTEESVEKQLMKLENLD